MKAASKRSGGDETKSLKVSEPSPPIPAQEGSIKVARLKRWKAYLDNA